MDTIYYLQYNYYAWFLLSNYYDLRLVDIDSSQPNTYQKEPIIMKNSRFSYVILFNC